MKPILLDGEQEVFFNQRYLVKGIDYHGELLSGTVVKGGTTAVIQNLKFMSETANNIDIYRTAKTILSRDTGYIVDGIIPKNINNEAFISGITKLYINGRLVPYSKITQTDTHYEIDASYCGNGYVYQFVNAVSSDFYTTFTAYMNAAYFDGRKEALAFFIKKDNYSYSYPSQIIISYENKIFSSYLNEIIKRIIDGRITVYNTSDDNDIINQLRDYEYLKKFDVLFTNEATINRRFVDVFPGYLSSSCLS